MEPTFGVQLRKLFHFFAKGCDRWEERLQNIGERICESGWAIRKHQGDSDGYVSVKRGNDQMGHLGTPFKTFYLPQYAYAHGHVCAVSVDTHKI